MQLKTKASLLLLISLSLYLMLSFIIAIPAQFIGLSNNYLFALSALFVSIPAFLAPSIVFRRVNRFPAFKAPKFWQIMLAVMIGVGCVHMNEALSCLNSAVLYNVDVASNSTTAETVMELNVVNMFISLAVIPPICEEFLLRGTLLESWRRYGPIGAAILTSLIFALLHMAPSAFIVYFCIGMLLAAVYIITRNVWLTVIIHFINNLSSVIAAVMLKYMSDASLPGEESAIDSVMNIFGSRLGYVALALIYAVRAAVFIVPGILILRSVFRKRRLGKYADTAPLFIEGDDPAAPLPDPYLKDGALFRGNRTEIWEDILLWVSLDILIVMNVISGLSEFGIIKMG